MRRAVSLLLLTLILPGSAQIAAGNKALGRVVLRCWLALLAVVAVLALLSLMWPGLLISLGTGLFSLNVVRVVMIVLAVGWAALFVDAWRLADPGSLRRNQRLALVAINGFLCFSVVGGLLFGAHLVGVQRDFIATVFGGDEVTDPTHGRYNVLLVGADAGEGRVGLRTDSMTVASIDEETGQTVLISLPRNLQNFPFAPGSAMDKEFPSGFDCDDCYLNGVSTWATDHPEVFGSTPEASEDELFTLGMDATVSAVEGVTDLSINYWTLVDMRGFEDIIDAVGGVEINVRSRIPIGGVGSPVYGYIEPGTQQLDGYEALWFTRSREDSDDYSRMARQKCVMNAMLRQLDPMTLVTKYSELAEASSAMLETNIPASEVDTFVDLALKASSEPMATVSIVPPEINTADPDMDKVHQMIRDAIRGSASSGDSAPEASDPSEGAAPPSGEAGGEAGAESGEVAEDPEVTGGSIGTRDEGYAANETEDLGTSC